MPRIAVISADIALPGEKGLARVYDLACRFQAGGFDTELITSDFQHWHKEYRTKEEMEAAAATAPFRLTFQHGGRYKKNLDPRRIAGYRALGKNIAAYLDTRAYDLIYTLVPDNYIAYRAAEAARKKGVPCVADVEDLWPEAMRMVLDVPVLSDTLFWGFSHYAKKTYARADAVVGSSDTYRDEPLKYGIDVPKRKTVYVGNALSVFDKGAAAPPPTKKQPGEFWVTYAGTLGASYDLATLIEAAKLLKDRGETGITVLLLGDGPDRERLETLAKASGADVRFPGFVPYETMAAFLRASDIAVNSLVPKAAQSIVSKIGDYLAAGIPMINTGLDPEFKQKVTDDGFGVNVPPEDPEALADAIAALRHDEAKREEMGKRAKEIAVSQFNREETYPEIVRFAASLLPDDLFKETNE